ncbi:acetate kinase [Paenarthrobacter nicotinovorans]|uniref:acetate/propionate family kinase n=1 Tax=Micrococcaceae TaxID=1268 RepID=UPI000876D3B9|nr:MULTISPECIES: acetate/propionate family kinase [Micrococcaceae]MDR6436648.1 acetate kinase [Paenarthrobacter nicotinovorans]SCZ57031.1 acetate kinase [Arthrobacter sp. UNCCL28]
MRVLVLNPGSSSLKYHLRDTAGINPGAAVLASGQVDWPAGERSGAIHLDSAFEELNESLKNLGSAAPEAIGHRVVHGGEQFSTPVRVTADVITAIEELSPLAPLHNPASVACIAAAGKHWPALPQVAVFDTAFHGTIPDFAACYAIPEDAYRAHPVRRYGFHGISVEMACRDTAEFLGIPLLSLNLVVAHIGNGASVTAVRQGLSVDTSMGMTPLEGLVMGTRSGDLDPSIVLLMQQAGATAEEVDHILNHRSGLLALAGTADMREISAAAAQRGEPRAILALNMATYRLAKYIAAYSMVVGRPDALVFTGGVGENSALFRDKVAAWLGPLGLGLAEDLNSSAQDGIRKISAIDSAIAVLVVPSDEERAIAESTAALLAMHPKEG